MDNIEKLEPRAFTKFCMSIGAVPSSYIAGLTIEEQLLWFCSYLEKTVIPAVNNNAEAVEELQNLYIQLKDYVDNYFDNLDVQEEINNKLDEMAESGELADIIAEYLQLAGILAYDTKADMKAAENLDEGSICKTLGNLTYSDGQGAFYRVREVLTTDVIDDENIIALHNPELVAEKILYSSGYDLQQEINSLDTKIDNNERNSKYVLYIFCDNAYRQTTSYVRELLERGANAGFKESQMTIHINDDGTLVEDETKFTDYNDIADELNIPIKSVKIHGNYNATNYLTTSINMLEYFPSAETIFIYNEQLNDVAVSGTSAPAAIKAVYPNIKVGFTVAYNQCFWGNNLTQSQWDSLSNNYDIMGVHMYPSGTTYVDSSFCNYENVIDSFNNPQFICPWNKEIWITESGVLPFWQFLSHPESYDTTKLTDTTLTVEPQRIFFRALNNCNMAQKAIKIIPWFMESGMSEPNHELFNIFKNIITGR